jgi:hypothetical protein
MKLVRISLLSVLAPLAFVPTLEAQTTPRAAVIVGVSRTSFSTQPDSDVDAGRGLVVGAFGVLRRDKALKIQPEVQFSQRRVNVFFGGDYNGYKNDYVNLSLFLRTNLFKGLYSIQGPQFSFPVNAELELALLDENLDLSDNTNPDFSLVIGLGRQFGRIGVEGRWDSGFRRVEEAPLGNFVKRNRAATLLGIIAF